MTQKETIRNHLQKHGYITKIIANNVYFIGDVRKVISELRKEGMNIVRTQKADDFGRKYSCWKLEENHATAAAA